MSPREGLRRRLRYLAVLEVANIPLQAFLWFGLTGLPATWPNLTGFTLFAVLLIQGAAYWAAKLGQLRTRRPHPRGLAAFACCPRP